MLCTWCLVETMLLNTYPIVFCKILPLYLNATIKPLFGKFISTIAFLGWLYFYSLKYSLIHSEILSFNWINNWFLKERSSLAKLLWFYYLSAVLSSTFTCFCGKFSLMYNWCFWGLKWWTVRLWFYDIQ